MQIFNRPGSRLDDPTNFQQTNIMGTTSYSTETRTVRAAAAGYDTKSAAEIFTQREIHETMNPLGVTLREARDSEAHPSTVPIVLGLDVTASMGHIPHALIKSGLPTLMSGLIRTGLLDATLCFVAVTDHLAANRAPFQMSQFESGDAELDMWLERTWLEGGGGGQDMESYMLAWLFALHIVQTDAWDKRRKKGFLITIGDERNHPDIIHRRLVEIFGPETATLMCPNGDRISSMDILRAVQERWNVFHISVRHDGMDNHAYWAGLLGNNAREVRDPNQVPATVAQIILDHPEVDGAFDPQLFHGDPVVEREMEVS
jgi:hypothetical protein